MAEWEPTPSNLETFLKLPTFELTLIAKGSPVTVRLDNGHDTQERTLAPEEIWRASVPAIGPEGLCTLTIAPSGIVGSTRFEYVPGF